MPLFIEEITQAVLESSVETGPGEPTFASASALVIPPTLQDSLATRLDRLDAGKALLQLAATIGRNVPFDLLLAVSNKSEPVLHDEIERLVAVGLLLRRGSAPQEQYVFKHALIHDAAYSSLLKSVRHRTVARRAGKGHRHRVLPE